MNTIDKNQNDIIEKLRHASTNNDQWKKDRISSAINGTNPTVITKMKSGFVVFGDTQFLPGYCVLISYPKVRCLNDLSPDDRKVFLSDMVLIGDAMLQALSPIKINYEILSNSEEFLHAHIFPRYSWESEELKKMPVWLYPKENWSKQEFQFYNEQYVPIRDKLACELIRVLHTTNY